jgi:hypothetical protein
MLGTLKEIWLSNVEGGGLLGAAAPAKSTGLRKILSEYHESLRDVADNPIFLKPRVLLITLQQSDGVHCDTVITICIDIFSLV